ncbi:MAG TPA: hypothetical protein DFR83_00005, partial [Deltaproteobacteria bacterium]|nr:hypothetical protein [Deltaproteobacteria bacterium]
MRIRSFYGTPSCLGIVLALAAGCERSEKGSDLGYGVQETADGLTDADGDGFLGDEDCADGDASVNPGAVEICNGLDDNCDGTVGIGNINAS